MTRLTLIALALCAAPLSSCRRKNRQFHVVSVTDVGRHLMVSGIFGIEAPAAAGFAPAQSYSGVRSGRCMRIRAQQPALADPEAVRRAAARTQQRFRDAGDLIVREDGGPELAVLRPAMQGLYVGVVPRGEVRRLRVRVAGGSGVEAHEFNSIPLNPAGNPVRITSPVAGFVGRRGAPLRITWAGAGYRDAFLNLTVIPSVPSAARILVCRLDYGRGAITLSGADLDVPEHRGELMLTASLLTMTSSEEGAWLLNAMSMGASLIGTLR